MIDIAKILAKVAHLRTLAARAGTRAEAEAAAQAADEIIQKYRLTESEVERAGQPPEEKPGEGSAFYSDGRKVPTWLSKLARLVANHYGCHVWLDLDNAIHIVGRASDIEIARYMFAWATISIEKLSWRERGVPARNAFKVGACTGFRDALNRGKIKAVGSNLAGLVLQSRLDESLAFANTITGGFQAGRSRRPNDLGAFMRGRDAGRNLHTGAALAANRGKLLR